MNIAICDDDKELLEYLKVLTKKWSAKSDMECKTDCFVSSEDFLFVNENGFPYDVVILDIQMGGINGMELAKEIRNKDENISIVFLTGIKDYVFEGYEVGAIRYMMKPIKEDEFFNVLDIAASEVDRDKKYCIFSYGSEKIKIPCDDIMYVESDEHYVIINTSDKKYKIKYSINKLLKELNPDEFAPAHRSYIVNVGCIEKITKTECILENGVNIPVSRNNYGRLNQAFIKYYIHKK